MTREPTRNTLDEIERLFIAGDLESAQRLAERTLSALAPGDATPYSLLLAKIKLYEGRSLEAAHLLQTISRSQPTQELTFKRDLLLGIAESHLSRTVPSDQSIEHASDLHPEGVLKDELQAAKGAIALDRGQLNTAEALLKAALDGADSRGELYLQAELWMNLGVVAMRREHYEDAVSRLTKSSLVAQKLNARLALEKSLGNLGWVYYQVGDYRRALDNLQTATDEAARTGATLDEIQWLQNCGMSEAAIGEPTEARQFYDKSLLLAEFLGDTETELSAHVALATLMLQSAPLNAVDHVAKARKLAERRGIADEKIEVQLLEGLLLKKTGDHDGAISVLSLLVSQTAASPWIQWQAEYALANIYLDESRLGPAEIGFKRAILLYRRQRTTLKSVELLLPFLENGSDLYMGYTEYLIRAGRTGEALQLLDTSRAETLADGLGTAPARRGRRPDPRALAERLNATILVYCLRPERSYLWAITGKRREFYTLPGSGTILPLVERHNETILRAKDLLARKDSTGRALYDALLAPAAELLPHGGGRVVLVADSALSRLNFETLIPPCDPPSCEAPRYWIEDASVINARSLRLLASGTTPQEAEGQGDHPKMLLIGDPVYAKGGYAPLPNAGAEMAGIAGHFAAGDRVLASGRDASPEAYAASRPERFRFVHFVAHATASELNPLDSAVILSSGGSGGGSGTGAAAGNKLYASEILKQPLSAELVTLSSCFGSGVRDYTGEGVVGLVWAFLRAGAHGVIGALWEVSDVATPKLMDTLYTRLLTGETPDQALRQAKLEMLHSDGVFRKPVYWGAFQLYAGR